MIVGIVQTFEPMQILSFILFCSMLPLSADVDLAGDLEVPTFQVQSGLGEPAFSGDRVTVQYWIQDLAGKEIANSEKRGLPLTFDLLASNSDPLLQSAALGCRVGEIRGVVVMSEDLYPDLNVFSLIKNPGPLLVQVRVDRIQRR